MDNVRVTVQGVDVGTYSSEEMGLAITFQQKLITEINTFAIPVVKTIKLPFTKELSLATGFPQDIDSKNFVSLTQEFDIQIRVSESLTIDGWIKPIRVVLNGIDEWLEFSISPKQKEWVDLLKEFKLTELDLVTTNDQTHTLTEANIRTSETQSFPTRMYTYAPIDIGEISRVPVLWVDIVGTDILFYYLGLQISASTFVAHTYGFSNSVLWLNWQDMVDLPDATWNAKGIYIAKTQNRVFSSTKVYDQKGYLFLKNHSWQVGDFYPCISITQILQRCFDRIGWSVVMEDSDQYLDDKYNFLHNVEQLNKYEKERNYFKVKVPDGGYSITFTGPVPTIHSYVMPFMNTSIPGFVPSADYIDTNSDVEANVLAGTNLSKYTATESIIIRAKWVYRIGYTITTSFYGTGKIELRMRHRDSGGTLLRQVTYQVFEHYTGAATSTGEFAIQGELNSGYFYMESGDFIECILVVEDSITSSITKIYEDNTFESIMYEGGNFKGKTIRLNEYLPDVYALDWLKDISLINNLQLYTNDKLKTVYMVRDDNKKTGKVIDFKNKINKARPIEIEEICSYHPKSYEFNWKKDSDDWAVDVVEQVIGERFAKGTLTNPNLWAEEAQNIDNSIYSASLDKFEVNNIVNFETVEMKGKETYQSLPTYKRVDYEPRYLRLLFGETLQDHALPGADEGTAVYDIEGSGTLTEYVKVEFQTDLHYSSLLTSKYAQLIRKIQSGIIVRAYLVLSNKDMDTFTELLKQDNDFRSEYEIMIKRNVVLSEINKIIDYRQVSQEDTQVEFVIIKDEA